MATVRYLVSNVRASATFFCDRLGFEVVLDMPPAFVGVRRGDLDLWLAGPLSSAARPMPDGRVPGPGGWNRLVLEVEDLASMVDDLRGAGSDFRNDMVSGPGGKQIVLDDPDGNPIELFEARR